MSIDYINKQREYGFGFKIRNFLKSNLFAIIIFAIFILVRLPREYHIIGVDTYEVLWMARGILDGALLNKENTWLLNFFSYLGFYPFSHYPIGIPLLLASLLYLRIPVEIAYFIITIIVFLITYFGIKKLSKCFFDKEMYQNILIFFYINSPIFLRFTYMTVHPRAFIMAFTPWFIYFLFKASEKPNVKNIGFSIFIFTLMIFTHRVWVGSITFVLMIVFTPITAKFLKKRNFERKKALIYIAILLIFYLVLCVLCFTLFNVDSRKINSPWLTNDYTVEFIGNIALDYSTRIGIAILTLPFGVYVFFKRIYSILNKNTPSNLTNKEIRNTVFIGYALVFICISWILTTYTTILFLILLIIISTLGCIFIFEKNKNITLKIWFLSSLIFSSIISLLYLQAQKAFITWIQVIAFTFCFISIIMLVLPNHYLAKNKIINKIKNSMKNISNRHNYRAYFLLFVIGFSFFSVTVQDGSIKHSEQEFPSTLYISNEEKEIISVIKHYGIEDTIFCATDQLAWHIGGYGFLPTIFAFHKPQQLYYNWIDPQTVYDNLIFTPWKIINEAIIFSFPQNPEKELFDIIRNLNCSDFQNQLPLLKDIGIQYCVALKKDGNLYPVTISTYGVGFSIFLDTISHIPALYETEHLLVFKFY